jgi:hypothetical protein
MARSLLIEAQLPKTLWFWAVCEAVQRMNFISVEVPTSEVAAKGDIIKTVATAQESFYEVKPDLRILFPFGAICCCHRPSDGGRGLHRCRTRKKQQRQQACVLESHTLAILRLRRLQAGL